MIEDPIAPWKKITAEQLKNGWIEMRGATPIHHNFIVIRQEGENYVVRNPELIVQERQGLRGHVMKWGIYDTKDECWIGDQDGPRTFDEEVLAKVAAQMCDVQMRWALGRCLAREYHGEATQKKDELDVQRTPLDALRRLERGSF